MYVYIHVDMHAHTLSLMYTYINIYMNEGLV